MSEIELRRACCGLRGAPGGDSAACWAKAAAAAVDEGTSISADLDAEMGDMSIDCGRERPIGGSEAVGEVAGGGIGRRREPGCEDGCFVCLLGEGRGRSKGIEGSEAVTSCGEDERDLFVTGGGFIVDPEVDKIIELLLFGAVAVVGLLAFSRPPPHKSTSSCTELCLPLLFVLRLR